MVDWIYFFVASFTCLCFMVLPGLAILSFLDIPRMAIPVIAVPVSTFVYVLSGVVCDKIGFRGLYLFLIVNILTIIIILILIHKIKLYLKVNNRYSISNTITNNEDKIYNISISFIPAVLSTIILAFIYLKNLDGPSSYLQFADNMSHLTWIKANASAGLFSTVNVGFYPDSDNPLLGATYYPFGWHIYAEIIYLLIGIPVAMAENASIFAFVSVIFPSSVYLLSSTILNKRCSLSLAVSSGLLSSAGVAFPLRMLIVHGAYPNIAGFACSLIPVYVMCIFLHAVKNGENVGSLLIAFLFSLIGVAALHPNAAIFSCVMTIPLVLFKGISIISAYILKKDASVFVINILRISIIALCIVIWVALYKSSFMSAIVSFRWEWKVGAIEGFIKMIDFSLVFGYPQQLFSLLAFIGIIKLISKKNIWYIITTLFVFSIYYISGVSSQFKGLVSGFWYTDYERLAAMVTIVAVPLVVTGSYCVMKLLYHLLREKSKIVMYLCTIIYSITSIYIIYNPVLLYKGATNLTAFGQSMYELDAATDQSKTQAYTDKERAFVHRVKSIIGDTTIIINIPYDGSSYAYTQDNLNVLFRGQSNGFSSEPAKIIASDISHYASNKKVFNAIKSSGARYLLLLDRSEFVESGNGYQSPFAWFNGDVWKGFTSISDDTEGFDVVLQQGDMRLYRLSLIN